MKPLRQVVALGLICGCVFGAPLTAQNSDTAGSEEPLSAIDWLSQSVEQPETVAAPFAAPGSSRATRQPPIDEAPVTDSATAPDVTVQPLGNAAPRTLGLLSPALTGLPTTLWSNSDVTTLAALLAAQDVETLPALQSLLITMILTEADPPFEAATPGLFFQTRIDKLLNFGALAEAEAMLDAATPDTSALFRRFFDVSLLTGTENRACRSLSEKPDVAPTPAARIFCLARSGDWSAAALTLNTSRALGDLDDATADLLARFLDPELFEGQAVPTPPEPMTPLMFRMFEAIGEPLNTSTLPRAFAHSQLRPAAGWKAQLEAAERLAETGAIDANVLMSLYTQRRPSASGGVWERAAAVQALQSALENADAEAMDDALEDLWSETRNGALLSLIAEHYAEDMLTLADDTRDPDRLFETLLLTSKYEEAALILNLSQTAPFLASVAFGAPESSLAMVPDETTITDAFQSEPDARLVALSADGKLGEAVLRTLATVQQGLEGDRIALAQGIATLRALGLEDTARQTALQFYLLDRR
ncbi:MAG: hypothetical protein AAGL89_10305 [Pseudomonadota bacterium]